MVDSKLQLSLSGFLAFPMLGRVPNCTIRYFVSFLTYVVTKGQIFITEEDTIFTLGLLGVQLLALDWSTINV